MQHNGNRGTRLKHAATFTVSLGLMQTSGLERSDERDELKHRCRAAGYNLVSMRTAFLNLTR